MKLYYVWLLNGEKVALCADSYFNFPDKIVFYDKDDDAIATFFIDKICGWKVA